MPEQYVVTCTCGQQMRVGREHFGRTGKCVKCRKPLTVTDENTRLIPEEQTILSTAVGKAKEKGFSRKTWSLATPLSSFHTAEIIFTDTAERFENKVRYLQSRIAEGNMPRVTILVLDSCDPSSSHKSLILQVGTYDEYVDFVNDNSAVSRREKLFPGQGWAPLRGTALANGDLPGADLVSREDFDKLISEIESGKYVVRSVLAVEGVSHR